METTDSHLEQSAIVFILEAMAALHEERVLPAPDYGRFLKVGRDYFGPDLMQLPSFQTLEQVFESQFESRFKDPLKKRDAEFPNQYIFSMLEAVVVRSRGRWPLEPADQAISDSISELVQVLGSPTYGIACIRQVSHLTTEGGLDLEINGLIIVPERTSRRELLQRVCDEIPAAPSAWNREPPFAFDPPHSLVIAKDERAAGEPFEQANRLSRQVERFLLATRLLTSGTLQTGFEIQGPLRLVSRMHPTMRGNENVAFGSLVRRTARLRAADQPAIAALSGFIEQAVIKREGMVTTPFDVALIGYNRSHRAAEPFEQVVDLATALEAVLTGDVGGEGLTLRLATRAALLLQTTNDPSAAIFEDVRKLYELRSTMVHGSALSEKNLRKVVQAISTVPDRAATERLGIALGYAIDRLRDLVRRSILARLSLASGADPVWPWGSRIQIEGELLDPVKAAEWRSHWHETLSGNGAAGAADQPRAAVEFVSTDDR